MKKSRSRPRTVAGARDRPAARRSLAMAALIVVLGAVAYANSFSNPFIHDDLNAVIENERIRQLWPLSVPLSPPAETPVARRPIVNLSFAVNYAVGGLDVRGYHAVNLGIHLLNALLLFGLVRRTLTLPRLADRFGQRATPLAAVCALVWTVHPLHSEVVNYVSQRTTAMMGLFYLLTLYCGVRAHDRNGSWRAGAVLACAAGMASKESMVTAPVMVLLFDRVLVFPSFAEAIRRRRSLYLGLFATWTVLGVLIAGGGRTTVGFDAGVSAPTYLLNQAPVLVDYLRLAVWPRGLVVDYGVTPSIAMSEALGPLLAMLTLLTVTLISLRRWPAAGFAALAFFILLAPTSSIVPIATEVGAERRMYLPLAALVVLVTGLSYRAGTVLISRRASDVVLRGWNAGHIGACAATLTVGIICAALTAGTHLRNREYHSRLTLAQTTVERRPHGRAYYSLAHALFENGRRDEALRYFRRSASDFPPARFALGTELMADGLLDAGIEQLRTFATLVPDHVAVGSARQLLASALVEQRKHDEAIHELNLLLQIEPRNARAHAQLGELLLLFRSRPDDAIDHLQQAARLGSSDARIRNLLGNALAMQGRFSEALVQFKLAARLDPGSNSARNSISRLEQMMSGRAGG
jgi:Flp pilus assembly protein TadD